MGKEKPTKNGREILRKDMKYLELTKRGAKLSAVASVLKFIQHVTLSEIRLYCCCCNKG